jgi:hypothetical protein
VIVVSAVDVYVAIVLELEARVGIRLHIMILNLASDDTVPAGAGVVCEDHFTPHFAAPRDGPDAVIDDIVVRAAAVVDCR